MVDCVTGNDNKHEILTHSPPFLLPPNLLLPNLESQSSTILHPVLSCKYLHLFSSENSLLHSLRVIAMEESANGVHMRIIYSTPYVMYDIGGTSKWRTHVSFFHSLCLIAMEE